MKIIKLLLLLVGILFIHENATTAKTISKEKALMVASNFYSNISKEQKVIQNLRVLRTSEDFQKTKTKINAKTEQEPYYYIISNNEEKGFIIVSAHDNTKPILGYSLEGKCDFNNIPPNMEYWFEYLKAQIKWAKENGIYDSQSETEWANAQAPAKVVKYFDTGKWNQHSPYNLQCPTLNGQLCLTGCVATSIAEVMNYFNWPESGQGITNEYTVYEAEGNVYVPSRDLNHSYDWKNIELDYSNITDETKCNAVATLLADVGAALKLSYSPTGTGGYELNECLVYNFKYSKDVNIERRNDYSDSEWIKILESELDQNRPLVYGGYDDSSYGGHSFVIDGYDDSHYFHVNWGWGGSYNGYFLISALNVAGRRYNTNQDVLLNFYPDNGTIDDPSKRVNFYYTGFVCSCKSFNRLKTFTIDRIYIKNHGAVPYSGTFGLLMTDKNGNIIEELNSIHFSDIASESVKYWSWNVTITKALEPGYRLRLFHKPDGYNNWYPLYRDGAKERIIQEIIVCNEKEDFNIGSSGYSSIYSANNLIVPPGVEVLTYTYDQFSCSLIPENRCSEGDIIPAETGFIIKGNPGTYSFSITKDTPSIYYYTVLSGTFEEINTPSGDVYVLGNKSGRTTFYKYNGSTIPAGKVYFIKP